MSKRPASSYYRMYLSINNLEQLMELPVNPESIEIGESGNAASHEIVGLGEVVTLHQPKLSSFSFSSFFPAQQYSFVHSYQLHPPIYYINLLKKWMARKLPIRFIITSPTYTLNKAVYIEEFTWRDVAGTNGDLEFDISLKEYRFFQAEKVEVVASKGKPDKLGKPSNKKNVKKTPKKRPDLRKRPATYKLQKGDNLWVVSRKFYGSDKKAREIQRHNKIRNDELGRLQIGREIRLP
ncbi:LysM peptidoglycan-binding domain-containing protein [Paenibacillus sp. 481]|uniref:LysM peptidoglycan-binding domain-containing protein n=1 Tax=Paenibacillus sp. 481 TaxID=2835869 RepID=UPI001E546007|nr:LysM domain-containing protein [Paenibacillus sp. 481]UHA72299.1 LysM peptidoglycan-binding domain-containing protein [Paenibacillus sp. 481]